MKRKSIYAILVVLSLSLAACAGNSAKNDDVNDATDSAKEETLSVEIVDGVLKRVPENTAGEFVIPEGVTTIGKRAFYNCDAIQSIVIPESVTTIEEEAFKGCRFCYFEEIIIPESVTTIGKGAFEGCAYLEKITLPRKITEIQPFTFRYCNALQELIIPEGVVSIGESAFCMCKSLSKIIIPEGVISIGESAFYECKNLREVVIPESVTTIGNSAFYWCSSLSSIELPNVTFIGDFAFDDCFDLTNAVLPKNVTLGEGVFEEDVVFETAAEKEDRDKIEALALNEIYKAIKISSVSYVDDNGEKISKRDVSMAYVMAMMEKYAPKYKLMTQDGEVKTAKYMDRVMSNSFENATSDSMATIYNWIEIPQANGGTFSITMEIWDLTKFSFDYVTDWLRGITADIDEVKDMEVQWEEPVVEPTEAEIPDSSSSDVVIRSSYSYRFADMIGGTIYEKNLSVSELMKKVEYVGCTGIERGDFYVVLRFGDREAVSVNDTNNGTSQEQWDEFQLWVAACEKALDILYPNR